MTLPDEPDPAALAPMEPPVGSPPMAAPQRRRGLIVVGIVVVVVLLGAGVATAMLLKPAEKNVAAAPPTTTPPATAAPTPTDPPAYSGPLQALVVPKPAGATDETARPGDADGSLSQQQVASEYSASYQAAISAGLTNTEFQRGVFIAWRDKGTLVYIQIYQFRYDREAGSWSVVVQRGIQDSASSTAYFDEMKDGRWFVTKTADGRGGAHAVFSKGPFVVLIDTFKTGAADLDGTKALAVQQYGRLP